MSGRCLGDGTKRAAEPDGPTELCVLRVGCCVLLLCKENARRREKSSNVSRESKVEPRMPPWLSMPQLLVPWEGLGRRSSVQKVGGRIFFCLLLFFLFVSCMCVQHYTGYISAVWWREQKIGEKKRIFFLFFQQSRRGSFSLSSLCVTYKTILPTPPLYIHAEDSQDSAGGRPDLIFLKPGPLFPFSSWYFFSFFTSPQYPPPSLALSSLGWRLFFGFLL